MKGKRNYHPCQISVANLILLSKLQTNLSFFPTTQEIPEKRELQSSNFWIKKIMILFQPENSKELISKVAFAIYKKSLAISHVPVQDKVNENYFM